MSIYHLTAEQVRKLRENPYVANVTTRTITFTSAFKKIAYDRLCSHEPLQKIFSDAGFDVDVIGKKRMENFRAGLEKSASREEGFTDLRRNNHRQQNKSTEADLRKRIQQLEHEITYLEQENRFLKKITEAEEQ